MKKLLLLLLLTVNFANAEASCQIINFSTSAIKYEIFKSQHNTPCAAQILSDKSGLIEAKKNAFIDIEKTQNTLCITINNSLIGQFAQNDKCAIIYTKNDIGPGKLSLNKFCQKQDTN